MNGDSRVEALPACVWDNVTIRSGRCPVVLPNYPRKEAAASRRRGHFICLGMLVAAFDTHCDDAWLRAPTCMKPALYFCLVCPPRRGVVDCSAYFLLALSYPPCLLLSTVWSCEPSDMDTPSLSPSSRLPLLQTPSIRPTPSVYVTMRLYAVALAYSTGARFQTSLFFSKRRVS